MDKKKSFLNNLIVLVTAIAAAFIASMVMKPAIGSTFLPVAYAISAFLFFMSANKYREDGKGRFCFFVGYFVNIIAQVIAGISIASFAALEAPQLAFTIAISIAMPANALIQIISKKQEESPKAQLFYHLIALVIGLVLGFIFAMIIKGNVSTTETFFGTEYSGFTPFTIIIMVLSYFGLFFTFPVVPILALVSRKNKRVFAKIADQDYSRLRRILQSYDRKTNSFCFNNGVRWYRNSPIITLDLKSKTVWIEGSVNVNLNKANYIKGHIDNLDDEDTVEGNAYERVNEMLAFARKTIMGDIKKLSKRFTNYGGEWSVKAQIKNIHYFGN